MRPRFDIASELANRQHGRVSWRQLVDERIPAAQIQRWLEDGRLRPVHHGVYAVGHTAPSLFGDLMAAVLACGDGSAVSHASGAQLLSVARVVPRRPEITVPTTAGRRRPGIVVHRVATLPARDVCTHHGIAVTTVPRVLLDLAPRLAPADLARACHEAWVHHRVRPAAIEACIARNPAKKGAAKLRRALGSDVTLSMLEDAFLVLLKAHGLALPRTNIDHRGDKVDCHWPDRGLTVELVTFRYHGTRYAFEKDTARRRRSNHIAYTYGDVVEQPVATVADLRERLGD
jgi:hypothetical protein